MDFSLLCKTFGISNKYLLKALDLYGDSGSFLEASLSDIQPLVSPQAFHSICSWRCAGKLPPLYGKTKDYLDSAGVTTLSLGDEDYPELLTEIPAPPAVLFVKGSLEKLSLPQVAIVGSRRASAHGMLLAEELAEQLGRSGFAITSGLALGIDSAAHTGAIKANVTTFAVMGTGIDQIYPARHKGLANEILASGGALLTEFMPGSPPKAEHFPQRNRIVTGLSLGVLVVEANERSGSLISARLAAEQGRAVCAIPGSIRSPVSAGCHYLIREGATLVTNAQQVVEQLGPLLGFQIEKYKQHYLESSEEKPEKQSSEPADLKKDVFQQGKTEDWLLKAMGFDTHTVEELCKLSGRTAAEINVALAELELCGEVSQTEYGYQRLCL